MTQQSMTSQMVLMITLRPHLQLPTDAPNKQTNGLSHLNKAGIGEEPSCTSASASHHRHAHTLKNMHGATALYMNMMMCFYPADSGVCPVACTTWCCPKGTPNPSRSKIPILTQRHSLTHSLSLPQTHTSPPCACHTHLPKTIDQLLCNHTTVPAQAATGAQLTAPHIPSKHLNQNTTATPRPLSIQKVPSPPALPPQSLPDALCLHILL